GGYGAAFLPTGGGPGTIPFPSETAGSIRDHKQVTQEFRVESKGNAPLSWQAGIYYFDEAYGFGSYTYNTPPPGSPRSGAPLRTDQSNPAWAVSGSTNYAFSNQFSMRAGLRYTQDKKDLVTQPLPAGDPNPTVTSNGLSGHTDDSKVSGD